MRPEIGQLLALDGRRGARHRRRDRHRRGDRAWCSPPPAPTSTIGDIDVDGARARRRRRSAARADRARRHRPRQRRRAVSTPSTASTCLVNNAGTYLEAGSILDQTHESWRRSIDVNLAGVFNCAKAAATAMVDGGRPGSIVNIASVDGILPCLGTGYDSAKAAVIQLTRSLAVDLAPHAIRVNGVAPGNVPVPTLARIHAGELPPLWPRRLVDDGADGADDAPAHRQHPARSARAARRRSPTPCCSSPRPPRPTSPATRSSSTAAGPSSESLAGRSPSGSERRWIELALDEHLDRRRPRRGGGRDRRTPRRRGRSGSPGSARSGRARSSRRSPRS